MTEPKIPKKPTSAKAREQHAAERMRKAGGHVTYIEAPNEGHGIEQPPTQFYVGAAWMEFMSRYLGPS